MFGECYRRKRVQGMESKWPYIPAIAPTRTLICVGDSCCCCCCCFCGEAIVAVGGLGLFLLLLQQLDGGVCTLGSASSPRIAAGCRAVLHQVTPEPSEGRPVRWVYLLVTVLSHHHGVRLSKLDFLDNQLVSEFIYPSSTDLVFYYPCPIVTG